MFQSDAFFSQKYIGNTYNIVQHLMARHPTWQEMIKNPDAAGFQLAITISHEEEAQLGIPE